jgi:hypothetical protein
MPALPIFKSSSFIGEWVSKEGIINPILVFYFLLFLHYFRVNIRL